MKLRFVVVATALALCSTPTTFAQSYDSCTAALANPPVPAAGLINSGDTTFGSSSSINVGAGAACPTDDASTLIGADSAGPDRVYRVKPNGCGTVSVSLDASDLPDQSGVSVVNGVDGVNLNVYVLSSCPAGGSSIPTADCVKKASANSEQGPNEVLSFVPIANQDYFIVVESRAGDAGPYTISITGTDSGMETCSLPVELQSFTID